MPPPEKIPTEPPLWLFVVEMFHLKNAGVAWMIQPTGFYKNVRPRMKPWDGTTIPKFATQTTLFTVSETALWCEHIWTFKNLQTQLVSVRHWGACWLDYETPPPQGLLLESLRPVNWQCLVPVWTRYTLLLIVFLTCHRWIVMVVSVSSKVIFRLL